MYLSEKWLTNKTPVAVAVAMSGWGTGSKLCPASLFTKKEIHFGIRKKPEIILLPMTQNQQFQSPTSNLQGQLPAEHAEQWLRKS